MAEKIQFMHFIGKGPEAEALIAAAREGRAKYADAVKAFIAEHGFENTWSYKDRGVSGPLFAVQLSDEEAKVRGLKYHGRVSKDYAYTPRLNTAAGRKLAAALEQLNKDFFSANKFLLKETGMGHTVFYCARVGNSSAGYTEDAVLVNVPYLPEGGDGQKPTPPAWLLPCKESEFLAAQGL